MLGICLFSKDVAQLTPEELQIRVWLRLRQFHDPRQGNDLIKKIAEEDLGILAVEAKSRLEKMQLLH